MQRGNPINAHTLTPIHLGSPRTQTSNKTQLPIHQHTQLYLCQPLCCLVFQGEEQNLPFTNRLGCVLETLALIYNNKQDLHVNLMSGQAHRSAMGSHKTALEGVQN